MNWLIQLFTATVSMLLGLVFGWIVAHSIISTECDKLGGFYVDDKIYYCTEKF